MSHSHSHVLDTISPRPPMALDLFALALRQMTSKQTLERRPEPSQLIEDREEVHQYDRVMSSKLTLTYALALDWISRSRSHVAPPRVAVDLACGPGYFSLCLARFLDYQKVVGVDLSEVMLDTAKKNAARFDLNDKMEFKLQDINKLDFGSQTVDLCTFTNAAHHLDDMNAVRGVVTTMDRVTSPEGLVFVLDLARMKTSQITETYVGFIGHDYVKHQLPQFYESFYRSMYAAFTTSEFKAAVPAQSLRAWYHVIPFGLPTVQMLIGLPVAQFDLASGPRLPKSIVDQIVPRDSLMEWRLMKVQMGISAWNRLA